MYRFGARSEKNLDGVHPDLVKVCRRALELTRVDFAITDGERTPEEQAANIAKGASQTKRSRHLTGHAVDVAAYVDGKISWDAHFYFSINEAFQVAALELKIPIAWGGNWQTLKDFCHFELDRRTYK